MLHEQEKTPPGLASGKGSSVRVCDGLTPITNNSNMNFESLQGEISQRFQPKKAATLDLAAVYRYMDFGSRAARVRGCGTFLEFHVSEQESKLHSANFCKDRLCPLCNWRRSLKIFSQVSAVMNRLESDGYVFLFLTLTVRNCSAGDLPGTCQALFDGWRNLYHKKAVFQSVVAGTFRSLEVTRNKKNGTFHPHLHVILAVRPDYFDKGYLSQDDWVALWRSCCSLDYDPVIDIRRIKPDSRGLQGAVAEVAKYAVKSVDFLTGPFSARVSYVSSFLLALSGRRLCAFTGVFQKARRALNLDDVEDGDLVHVSDNLRPDVSYMIVRYCWKSGFYVQI